jgi:hypothetical protein
MAINFPETASITLRLVTGSSLSYQQMDDNFSSLQVTDLNIIDTLKSASFLAEANTFTETNVFAKPVIVAEGITGSLQGTASYADNALTASYLDGLAESALYAVTASYVSGTIMLTTNTEVQITGSLIISGSDLFTRVIIDNIPTIADTGSLSNGALYKDNDGFIKIV